MFGHSSFMPLKDVEHNFSTQNNPLQISTDQINCNTTPSHELASDRGLDASTSSDHSSSSIQIDLNRLHESLDHVNQYSKRRLNDKLPSVLMYEIDSTGHSCYKSISLRELLNYVNAESNSIDEAALAQFVTFEGGSNFDTVHPNEAGGVCSPRHQQEQHDQIQQSLRLDVYSNLRRSSTSADNLPAFGAASHSAFPASVSGTAAGLPDLQGRRRGPAAAPIQRGLGSTRSVYDMRYSPTDATKVGIGFPPRSTGPITPTLPPVPDQTYEAIGALRLRDLRRLDFQFNPNEERSVLIRRHAVLFAMDPIRAVVMANRVILIVPDGADSLLNLLDQYMQEWVSANMAQTTPLEANTPPSEAQQDAHRSDPANVPAVARAAENESGSSTPSGVSNMLAPSLQAVNDLLRKLSTIGAQDAAEHAQPTSFAAMEHKHRALNTQDLPFEMHAIEALLTTVMALETQEFNRVNAQVQVILGYFRSGSLLPIEVQEKMRNRKNELLVMQRRISSARNAVHELTEDDEDMALMSLSVLRAKPSLYRYPLVPEILSRHDEVEELLESYLIDFNSLESKIELTRNQIQNAEELLSLRLDTSRNELLITNTVLAVLACCFGLGAYVTGIFGMNLDNTGKLQRTPHVFGSVIVLSLFWMTCLFCGLIFIFRRTGVFPTKIVLSNYDMRKT